MKVGRRGNGLAVRIPVNLIRALGLREGDEVDLSVSDGKLLIGRSLQTGAHVPD